MGVSNGDRGAELSASVYFRAWERMTEVLLTERDAGAILDALARITGETLGVDRSLIFQVKLGEQLAVGLCEWLNPEVEVTPTKATYPLATFAGGDAFCRRERRWLESHAASPSPAFQSDGSAAILHGPAMKIQSLLWYPFDFNDDGYYALIFNQVTHQRPWRPEEIDFLRVVTRQVHLALMQIAWHAERVQAERVMLEAQKAESIRLLAGGVAHDFNTLLGVVLSSLARARMSASAPATSALRDAERAAIEASVLAKHLLAYAGEGRFVVEPVDLAALVAEMQDLLRAAAGTVAIAFDLAGPAWVRADAGQLRQVLVNFVVNAREAIDANADGASGHVRVSVRAEPRGVVVRVEDDGVGMTPEVKRRVFEPFFSTKSLGRGLGLAAVSGIVEAHGGTLDVGSEPGKGTSMTVTLPEVPAPVAGERPRSSAPSREERRTILVVDDNDNFRRTCAELLADLGYEVRQAADGAAATELLLGAPEIDLALVDWTMPALSGAETFRRLRAARPALPIVVMSGYAESVTSELGRLELAAFLEKPFTVDALEAALTRATAG